MRLATLCSAHGPEQSWQFSEMPIRLPSGPPQNLPLPVAEPKSKVGRRCTWLMPLSAKRRRCRSPTVPSWSGLASSRTKLTEKSAIAGLKKVQPSQMKTSESQRRTRKQTSETLQRPGGHMQSTCPLPAHVVCSSSKNGNRPCICAFVPCENSTPTFPA